MLRQIVPNKDTGFDKTQAGDPSMKKTSRWIKSVTETAKANDLPPLPWQRGSRRAETIARRDGKALTPARRHA